MTVKELIQKHGGPAALNRSSGIPQQTISNWIVHNRIPVKRWPQLIRSGIDRTDLLEIHLVVPLRAAE